MNRFSDGALSWILLGILSLIWGSSFILMKLGLIAFSPSQLAFVRLSIAALCMLPFVFVFYRQISLRDILLLIVIGLTGNAIPAYLFALSETVIPSAVAGVLNSLSPIFTLLIAAAFFGLRFPFLNIVGVAIGFGGAVMVTLSGESADFFLNFQYSLLVVLATICYAISTNFIKAFFSKRNPILVTTFALISVGLPSLVYLLAGSGFIEVMQTHPQAWESLGYISILAALGTAFGVILFNRLLQINSIIFASSVTYTIPVVALFWGILDGEHLTWLHALGFAVILSGVYLVNRK